MRLSVLFSPATVLMATFVMAMSLSGHAEARDRGDQRHFGRRQHHERLDRGGDHRQGDFGQGRHREGRNQDWRFSERTEAMAGFSDDGRNRYDHDARRFDHGFYSNRHDMRRTFDDRFDGDRRPNRRLVVRNHRGRDGDNWERASRGLHNRNDWNREDWRRDDWGRYDGRRDDGRHGWRRYGWQRDAWDRDYGGDDFPSRTNGGTYFGGLSAWHEPGNGTYFRSDRFNDDDDGYGSDRGDRYGRDSRSRIIEVTPSSLGRGCSWESGVCVIRR